MFYIVNIFAMLVKNNECQIKKMIIVDSFTMVKLLYSYFN